jgi:hypothetical protein
MGDRLQHHKDNQPNKASDMASYTYPEICHGARQFINDFGNSAKVPKVTHKKFQRSIRWLNEHIRDDVIREKRNIFPTRSHCISNDGNNAVRYENPNRQPGWESSSVLRGT